MARLQIRLPAPEVRGAGGKEFLMEEHIEVQTQAQTAAASPAQDFDALLREKDFQSEFDRRVSRALEAARGRWAQETERKL